MRINVVASLLTVFIYAGDVYAQQPASTSVNLRSAFGLLQSLASMLPTLTETQWTEALQKEGLRRGGGQSMWRLRNSDGELRAERSANPDAVTYFLLFFPAAEEPVPPPMLDWMLRESRYVYLDEGDKFQIGLPSRPLAVGGRRGELLTEVTVYLPGGSVSRTAATINWPSSQ